MCQPAPLTSCPTIKANARLRRSRQWKDQTENKSPNNTKNKNNAPATPVKKNTRRRRRPTKKELAVKAKNDCDASTASTAPCSDDSLSDATPTKKSNSCNRSNTNANKNKSNKNNNASPQRRKRSKKAKSKVTPPKTINIPAAAQEVTEEEKAQYVALDAEMVGIGTDGFTSRLARVSLVNWSGDVIYDVHVKVEEPVTDYRTFVSGITKEDLESDNAVTFDEAQSAVLDHIHGKILVGHGLKNDFKVLGLAGELSHPWHDIRDTAKYEPFMKSCNPIESPTGATLAPKKLKVLAKDKLGMIIQQEGEPHSPVEDAVAALELYKKHRGKWEKVMKFKMERTEKINTEKRIRSDSL